MPLAQVKISELGAWFGRRNKSPQALMGGLSRAWWRWQHKYVQPKRAGIAPMFQLIAGSMLFFYAINYGKTSKLTNRVLPEPQTDPNPVLYYSCRAPQELQVPLIWDSTKSIRFTLSSATVQRILYLLRHP